MPYILTSTANPSSPQSWVRMETDSVLSGQSEFMNHRIQNGHRTTPRPLPPLKGKKKIFWWNKAILKEKTLKLIYLAGNYTLGSPGGHSASGLFTGGLANGGGPHHPPPHHSQHQQQNFLNGGSSLANLGLMTSSHNLPNIHNQSPTSVLSNYSLNRNLNQLNLNLVPRTNR